MNFINSINLKAVKIILSINSILIILYSLFIYYFDEYLILGSISSQNIFFEYVFLKILLGIFFFFSAVFIYKIKESNKWFLIIITSGILARLILIPAYPVVENDFYRYLWDGAVTANGVNPYKYSPKEALEENSESEVREVLNKLVKESGEIIHGINHPQIRTIYPPISQLIFALCYFIFPWKIWGLKVFFLLFDFAALFLFFKLLKKYDKPVIFIFLYWLNPIIIHEFYAGAHMDVLLVPFLLLILFFAISNSNFPSSLFISIAAGIKLWPVIFIPVIFRNLWQEKKKLLFYLFLTAAIMLIIFTPVFLTVFDRSLGFVVYAQSWTNNDAVFQILLIIVKQLREIFGIQSIGSFQLTRWLTGILFTIFLFFITRKKNRNSEDYFEKFLIITAVIFFISPTQFPWYFTWVIPFLVFRPMVSLLLYPVLLPLYQLNYLSPYFVYVQHIPILVLFLYELKTRKWDQLFNLTEVKLK